MRSFGAANYALRGEQLSEEDWDDDREVMTYSAKRSSGNNKKSKAKARRAAAPAK